ncbi:hypothetical protein AA0117_g13135 [Alternaria alternata]|uniref:Uncharacterized protein n=1 Tax=Alternaria alternata TaxID=5599 RepID=A0A4Q4MTS9_ALTAL|nr:hypothetical protein AA0117_g13135 [Alternaria alternata]
MSQRSAIGSIQSIKNEPEETEQNSTVSPTVLDDAKLEPDSVSA